jgi:hypothetical protein
MLFRLIFIKFIDMKYRKFGIKIFLFVMVIIRNMSMSGFQYCISTKLAYMLDCFCQNFMKCLLLKLKFILLSFLFVLSLCFNKIYGMGNAVKTEIVTIYRCWNFTMLVTLFPHFFWFVFLLPKTFKLLRVPICWTLRVIQKRTVLTKLDIYVFILNKQNEIVSEMNYCYDKIIWYFFLCRQWTYHMDQIVLKVWEYSLFHLSL